MRRKTSLYIADRPVDLDDQSFILFNYAMEDLYNPAVVKNSYSQQITLKGTARNNRLFGDIFRLDRRVANTGDIIGLDFDPSQKTPFSIYNEMNEVLESGYVKLDSVSKSGADIQYKVTLYGGLGSFFYALSYDDDGNKKTLASLDYLGTDNTATELDFPITAAKVLEAWGTAQSGTISSMWNVINFAPCLNGIPEGNFDAQKGLLLPSDVGLLDSVTEDSVTYTTKSNYSLVNLAEAQDEWAVKDLRAYLQRPVFSVKALLSAISDSDNNGGYSVDTSAIDDLARLQNLWVTLPMISSLGTIQQESGNLSISFTTTATTDNAIGVYTITGSVPSGTKVTANIYCKVSYNMTDAAAAYDALSLFARRTSGRNTYSKFSVLFIQAVAYGSDNSVVGGSKVKVIGAGRNVNSIVSACGYVPKWTGEGYELYNAASAGLTKVTGNIFLLDKNLGFSLEAQDIAYINIEVSAYSGTATDYSGTTTFAYSGDGSTSTAVCYADYDTQFTPASTFLSAGDGTDSVTYTSSESLRSGATITKALLLSSSHTPADYLLSLCKVFGLYFVYDGAEKKVTILPRNDLYIDETIDLTKRVDISKGVTIAPFVFNAKWYDFKLQGVGGAFYDEYLATEGKEYGIQRVNTGYDFNADTNDVMSSVVFRNAVSVMAKSKYLNYISSNGYILPSPFIDKGNTYTLWSTDGETIDVPISCPPTSASVTYYNTNADYAGYDVDNTYKVEFCDADRKPLGGEDVLLYWMGTSTYPYFKVTDDLPAMDTLNEGVPCWILTPGAAAGVSVPSFSRYDAPSGSIDYSLDFGVPGQLDIPDIIYPSSSTIYYGAWRAYLADRYDVDTKVMTCRVNLSGIQVGQNLLRKFYWYGNSLWVLNKIKNYSLTTYDPVECEFVQVQDKDNYLNGQEY